MLRKHGARLIAGLALTLVFLLHALHVLNLPFMGLLETRLYDVRLALTMPKTQRPGIAIVDLDERSLAEEGRWPWPRYKLAELLDRLFSTYHVAVVGFDVVFAEPDESSGLEVLHGLAAGSLKDDSSYREALRRVSPTLNYDGRFAAAMRDRPVVLGYYFTAFSEKSQQHRTGLLPAPAYPAQIFTEVGVPFLKMTGYGANLPELQRAAHGGGHFLPIPDFDGINRRVPMLVGYDGGMYESLSLAVAQTYLKDAPLGFSAPDSGGGYGRVEALTLGEQVIPVDDNLAALVPFRGPQGSFAYLSAADILHKRLPVESLKGAIVIVGTTAPGLMDLRATPVGPAYAGVEMHANLIAGILDGTIKQRPAYVLGVEIVTLLIAGLLLSLLLPFVSPLKATLFTATLLAVEVGTNLYLWQVANLVLPLASFLVMTALVYAMNMAYGFFVETRAKRQITGLFGQYVPPELVSEMSRDPERFTMEGESREMTVLFSDVRGFTTISEGLPPKELSQLMNEYMTPMTRIIHSHRGTIDKYIGDAIMAFWGAPLADEQHARNGILAALEMQKTLDQLRPRFLERGWPEIRIGVGLNTGVMSVGNMGSEFRLAYTVMGDAVNLGSRLEGVTKQYGVGILVSDTTRAQVPDMVFRELDRIRVKGKNEPVAIFEPLGLPSEVDEKTQHELELFERALKLYRAQDWDLAEMQLINLQQASPDRKVYDVYLKRIAHFRNNPPGENWDGVWVFETK